MPEISRFYGLIIAMYFRDHAPPHFHARYQGREAAISIVDLQVIEGSLPKRALELALEWARLHQSELQDNWNRARAMESLRPVEPLE
jgi:hypothetical protein